MSELKIFHEDDFSQAMAGIIEPWVAGSVSEGYLLTGDGARLHYYFGLADQPVGSVVIVHGFCEFFGKYTEMAWYYHQLGYSVFFLEQRGHGYSSREVAEMDLVHIDDFQTYVSDLKTFVDQIVLPRSRGQLVLFGHSMGGGIAALYLEEYPRDFTTAILSTPMLKVRYPINRGFVRLVTTAVNVNHREKELCVFQHHFDGISRYDDSNSLSPARYDYQFRQRLADEHYQTNGATFGWVHASLLATSRAQRHADRIRVPYLMFQAGRDAMVAPEGMFNFMEKAANAKLVRYQHAKHEVYNATTAIREDYYREIVAFLAAVAASGEAG